MFCKVLFFILILAQDVILQGTSSNRASDCIHTKQGDRWRDQCNWCRCGTLGLAVCTKIGCRPGGEEHTNEPECEGNAVWKKPCGWCSCVNNKAVCDPNSCVPSPSRPSQSAPAHIQNPNIHDSSHQPQSSNHGQSSEIENKNPSCEFTGQGGRWRDKCNWCRCSINGLSLCTKIGCTGFGIINDNQPQCEGNARWKKDCNWCNCANGRAICTFKACIPQNLDVSASIQNPSQNPIQNPAQNPAQCNEGFLWRQDCNVCLCWRGRHLCTKRVCQDRTGRFINPGKSGSVNPTSSCAGSLDSGICFGYFPRYGYNTATGACEMFVYGGCEGNLNNFESMTDCKRMCEGLLF